MVNNWPVPTPVPTPNIIPPQPLPSRELAKPPSQSTVTPLFTQPVVQTPTPIVQPVEQTQLVSQVPVLTPQTDGHFVRNYPIWENDPRRQLLKMNASNNPVVTSSVPTQSINPNVSTAQSIPQINASLPTVDTNVPIVNTNLPGVNAAIPTVNAEIPTVNAAIPTVNPTIPTINANIPTVNANIPTVNPTIPTVNPTIPTVNAEIPTVNPTIPTVNPTK